jgi:hypothetical protein
MTKHHDRLADGFAAGSSRKRLLIFACCQFMLASSAHAGDGGGRAADSAAAASKAEIRVRTENYPRPPYSGATYYIYERDGQVVCTKLAVCNKYDQCEITYAKGTYKDEEDIRTGEPFDRTDAVTIPQAKLKRHVCLEKFRLH